MVGSVPEVSEGCAAKHEAVVNRAGQCHDSTSRRALHRAIRTVYTMRKEGNTRHSEGTQRSEDKERRGAPVRMEESISPSSSALVLTPAAWQ